MPIPIELDRYTPQAVQLGDQLGNQQAARMAATGGLWARGMAQTGQTVQGAFGDLANGIERLGAGISKYQEKVEAEQTLADESGAAAHLSGTLKQTEDAINQTTTLEDVDRQHEGAKLAISDYGQAKGDNGVPYIRTDKARKAYALWSQMAIVQLDGLARDRKTAITRAGDAAKFARLDKEAAEVGVDNWPAAVAALRDSNRNKQAAGLLQPGEPAALELETNLAAAAAYRVQNDLDGMTQVGTDAELADAKGLAAQRLEEVKDVIPRGKLTEFREKLDRTAEVVRNRLERERTAASSDLIAGTSRDAFLVAADDFNPQNVVELDGRLLAMAKDKTLPVNVQEHAAQLHAKLVSEVEQKETKLDTVKAKAAKQESEDVGNFYATRFAVLSAYHETNPDAVGETREQAVALASDMAKDKRVSLKDAAGLVKDYEGLLNKTAPEKLSTDKKAAYKVIDDKLKIGIFAPPEYRAKSEKDRAKDVREMKEPARTAYEAEQDRNKLWALTWANDWFRNPANRNRKQADFRDEFEKALGERLTKDIAKKGWWQ